MIHFWDGPAGGFGCFCSRQAEKWNGLVIGNREERRGGEERKQEKEGEEEGEGKEKGKWHVQSGYENCRFPCHAWGECGTHGGNDFPEVLPRFVYIVVYRDFL